MLLGSVCNLHPWHHDCSTHKLTVPALGLQMTEARSSPHGAVVTNPTRNQEFTGSVPALAQWVNYPALP